MQEQNYSFEEIRTTLLEKLSSRGCSPITVTGYRYQCNSSSMVNDDISYETVRKVLGHSSKSAIKHYARIDIESLRRYSLAPPLPTGSFRAFLYGEVE